MRVVYTHSINGEPFYVGSGLKHRAYDFSSRSLKYRQRSGLKYVGSGYQNDVSHIEVTIIIEKDCIRSEIQKIEDEWIVQLRNKFDLVNKSTNYEKASKLGKSQTGKDKPRYRHKVDGRVMFMQAWGRHHPGNDEFLERLE